MKILSIITIAITLLLFPAKAYAVCPLCTIAVGAGLGLSRALGIDDLITSLWIGALIISSGLWLGDWLARKKVSLPYSKLIAVLGMYIITLPFLYITHIFGIVGNTLFGIDKIVLGISFGSLLFLLAVLSDSLLRRRNNGKVVVYYQKVLLPLLYLTLASFILYLLLA